MNRDILVRVTEVSDYILNTKQTIRATAKQFGISKSTVHKDIQDRLKAYDYDKYIKIDSIFREHIETRHILGGQSTKIKYQKIKQNS